VLLVAYIVGFVFCFKKRPCGLPDSLLAGSASAIVTAQTGVAGTIWIVIAVLNCGCHKICFDDY